MIVYYLTTFIIRMIFKIFKNVEFKNLDNIPKQCPVILVCSHKNWADIIISSIVTKRKIHYIAKKELFDLSLPWPIKPFVNWWLKAVGTIPIDREKPRPSTFHLTKEVLQNNGIITMFPEGTRQKEIIGKINKGAASIALMSKASPMIIPISITYSKKRFFAAFTGKVIIECGKPINTSNLIFNKQNVIKLTDKIAEKLKQLIIKNTSGAT